MWMCINITRLSQVRPHKSQRQKFCRRCKHREKKHIPQKRNTRTRRRRKSTFRFLLQIKHNMVSQKLEICIELVKIGVVFVATVAESVEKAFRKPPPALPAVHNSRRNSYADVPIPLVGFMWWAFFWVLASLKLVALVPCGVLEVVGLCI